MKQNLLCGICLLFSTLIFAQNNIVREEIQSWDGIQSKWFNSTLIEREYTDDDLLSVLTRSFWSIENNEWDIDYRHEFEYDAHDNIILIKKFRKRSFTNQLYLHEEVIKEYNTNQILKKETKTLFIEQGNNLETVTKYNDQACPIDKRINGEINTQYQCNELGQIEEELQLGGSNAHVLLKYEYDVNGHTNCIEVFRRLIGAEDWIFHFGYFNFNEADGKLLQQYQYLDRLERQFIAEWSDKGKLLSGELLEEDATTGEIYTILNIERTFEDERILNQTINILRRDFPENTEKITNFLYDDENNLIRKQLNNTSTFNTGTIIQTSNIMEYTNDCRGLATEVLSRGTSVFGGFTNKTFYTYQDNFDCDYINKQGAIVFPNPTKGLVQIFSPKLNTPNTTIQIFDAMGRLLLQKDNCCDDKQVDFELPNLSNGMYYIHIKNEKIDQTEKLMILK